MEQKQKEMQLRILLFTAAIKILYSQVEISLHSENSTFNTILHFLWPLLFELRIVDLNCVVPFCLLIVWSLYDTL